MKKNETREQDGCRQKKGIMWKQTTILSKFAREGTY